MESCLTEVLGSRSGALNDKRAVDSLICCKGARRFAPLSPYPRIRDYETDNFLP